MIDYVSVFIIVILVYLVLRYLTEVWFPPTIGDIIIFILEWLLILFLFTFITFIGTDIMLTYYD